MTNAHEHSLDPPPTTHRLDYPNVAAWLQDADSAHWWVTLLDTERYPEVTPPTMADMVLGPLEMLVKVVRDANPKGLAQFVKARFCDSDPANVMSARLELLCAADLAVMHVPFAFGGKGEADLTWNSETEAQAWLEIHRGAFDIFDNLQRAIEAELAESGTSLTIRLEEWPLEVRDRNVVHSRISRAIDAAGTSGDEQVIAMPEIAASAVVRRGGMIGLSRIIIEHGELVPSDSYLASLASRLALKVNVEKAGQARKNSWSSRTVLLVDISTARLAQLLGWEGLATWLDDVPIQWEDLPFAGVAICFSHFYGVLLNPGVCRYRPDLSEADRAYLAPTLSALGLPSKQ